MNEPRFAGFALDTALLVTLVTAWLFVAGWGYAEQWFGRFDLGVVGLGIPSGNFAMYGYWTLESQFRWLIPLAVAAAGAPLLWSRLRPRLTARGRFWLPDVQTRAALRAGWRILVPLLVLALFWAAYALGRAAANRDYEDHAASRFCTFPFARVVLKENTAWPKALPGLREDLAAGDRFRVLIQSGGMLALFQLNPPEEPRPRGQGLLVPVSEVSLIELDPIPPGCRPD